MKKEILKRLNRVCAICDKEMKIILYRDRTYRNGHYFFKMGKTVASEYWECPKCYWRKND